MFLGSPAFAAPSLNRLVEHDNIDVVLVVTQPDRPAGRGRKLTPPAVKTAATTLGLQVFQPETLRDDASVQVLEDAQPDLLVVVAYGELLRRNVLNLTPHGCLNVHPSLLPQYRGASPIPTAILNGDATTGVSIMKLVRKLDAGPVVSQVQINIRPEDTTGSLGERLADLAAAILPDVALRYVAGELTPIEQDEAAASHTREWSTADAEIDWMTSARQIDRLVRASHPWPVAWTTDDDTRLRIHAASVAPDDSTLNAPPGTVAFDRGQVLVATRDGTLVLNQVQPAGKRVMAATDWWRGSRRTQAVFNRSSSKL